jgi:hypothetical protein
MAAELIARDQAQGVGGTIGSLLRQTYQGRYSIVLVEDQNTAGIAKAARQTAGVAGATDRQEPRSAHARPRLRFYRVSPLWRPLHPATAVADTPFALDAAYQSPRRRGDLWQGRVRPKATATQ